MFYVGMNGNSTAPTTQAQQTNEVAANQYQNLAGAAQQNAAPQIQNPFAPQQQSAFNNVNSQQNSLVGSLQKTAANGNDSAAEQQYQAGVGQGAAATTALANSSGANPIAAAGDRRQAQQQNAIAKSASVAGGSQVAANAQAQAQQQLANVLSQQGGLQNQNYAQNTQQSINDAQLREQQNQINNAGQLGFGNLSNTEQQQYLTAGSNNSNIENAGAGIFQQGQIQQNAQNALIQGTVLGAGGAAVGAGAQMYNGLASTQAPPANAISSNPTVPPPGAEGNTSDFTGDTSDFGGG
jgi:hypothetical protein